MRVAEEKPRRLVSDTAYYAAVPVKPDLCQ